MKNGFRMAVLALAAVAALSLAGCGVTVEEIMDVVAPTEAPVSTADTSAAGDQTEEQEAEPLEFSCDSIDRVFSPFWAETDGDLKVVELTQLSLLAVSGSQSPSEISRETNSDGSVTVTIRLRDDICFSDGESVTADDLIFTYYVLADSDYDGPMEVNTLPIRGLSAYWNGMDMGMYEKYTAIYDEIYNNGKYDQDLQDALEEAEDAAREAGAEDDDEIAEDEDVKAAQEALDDYDTDKAEEIQQAIDQYWREDAQAIVDYCMENYSNSIEMRTGYTKDEVAASEGLQVMFAMVDTGYGTLDSSGALTGTVSGTVWDLETTFPTAEDFYNEMYTAYSGDAERYWSIEGYDRTSILVAAENSIVAAWAALDTDWQGPVTCVSGIEKVDDQTVNVTLEYCDETVLRTLCSVYVAPLHAYGDESLYDYASDSFGFTKGDLSAVRANDSLSLGAGEYVLSDIVGKTVYLEGSESYWLGAPAAGSAVLTEN